VTLPRSVRKVTRPSSVSTTLATPLLSGYREGLIKGQHGLKSPQILCVNDRLNFITVLCYVIDARGGRHIFIQARKKKSKTPEPVLVFRSKAESGSEGYSANSKSGGDNFVTDGSAAGLCSGRGGRRAATSRCRSSTYMQTCY
jgi:hypothetical protein